MAVAGRRTGPREPAPPRKRGGIVARHVEASPWGAAARGRIGCGRSRVRAGGELQLTASSSLYDLQRSAGALTFDDIRATMPLGEPVAAPQPAAGHAKKRKRKHRR